MRQEDLAAIGITVTQADRLRCAALHSHADLRVTVKMLRRLRFIAAWRCFQRAYDRLGKVVELEKECVSEA